MFSLKDGMIFGFSDELMKIAESHKETEKKDPHWAKEVAKGIGVAGAGAGLASGANYLLRKGFPQVFQQAHPSVAPIMKVGLPIMGGALFYVGDRYRRKLDDLYSKAPGYQKTKE